MSKSKRIVQSKVRRNRTNTLKREKQIKLNMQILKNNK